MIREGAMLRDRWRIDKRLGRGSMATVWAATHRNGDRVAIKVLHPELVGEGTFKQRFLREAYVANAVGHPGVVRVIDDDTLPDGTPFLVMDLLEGETLEAHRLRCGGKLEPAEVASVLGQVLETLDAAHRKNVVHRDLKPENLFREPDGRIRILDFGIARLLEGSELATQAGALLGTPAFMAPEQAAGRSEEIDARTDLWAVGAMGFLLLSGEKLYDAHSLQALINAILSKPPRRLGTVAPEVPASLAKVIDGALVRDKSQRWPSAVEMRAALRAFAPLASADVDAEATVAVHGRADLPDAITAKIARAHEEEPATTLMEAATTLRESARTDVPVTPEIATVTLVTPQPRVMPPALFDTQVHPIRAPEPPRAPPPAAPPRPMPLGLLLAFGGLFALLVTAVVIALGWR